MQASAAVPVALLVCSVFGATCILARCQAEARRGRSDDDVHDLKAWRVIDEAGLRGATQGGAQMSPKHPNFLINIGGATAADLEGLGEYVRKKVFQKAALTLEWEIMRVGEPIPQ